MKMHCWKCETEMRREEDFFHGFKIMGWKCPACKEIIYDAKDIQPILQYNKLKGSKRGLTVTVGTLGNSKIVRIPKVAEQIYRIGKGNKLRLDLEPERISIRVKA
ncbi:hypothetical protein HYV85_00240 [Candidatus Woesearchaeota archaeon]|nr:hypothetical protein [Candidatus Woesearchaeota archaeon]